MKQCPHCKSEILDDSLYCDRCGQHLMICADCGTYARGKFCPNCGGKHIIDPLEYEQQHKHEQSVENSTDIEKRMAELRSTDGSITLLLNDAEEYIIGRKSPQFGKQLAGCARMSRKHAKMWCGKDDGKWRVYDFASTHGTKINGYPLETETTYYINDGNTISFAGYEFSFTEKIE